MSETNCLKSAGKFVFDEAKSNLVKGQSNFLAPWYVMEILKFVRRFQKCYCLEINFYPITKA